MKILGIETSCDETAAAVVKDGREILSNVVVSQIDIFAEYGGVIPEVAARSHLEAMMPVVNKALSDAGCSWDEIDAIAVTHAPGLLGSLLIGTLTARTLAILHDKPLYAVHHLKSHVYANWLGASKGKSEPIFSSSGLELGANNGDKTIHAESRAASLAPVATGLARYSSPCQAPDSLDSGINCFDAPSFPLLALVISGGHTQILYMQKHNHFEIIGTTRDDAVGECFDKVAKILGLPYPGGPSIAKAAGSQLSNLGSRRSLPSVSKAASGVAACPSDTLQAALAKSSRSVEHIATPDATKYKFPHPKVEGLDFSFSGLKTAVLRAVQKELGLPISHPSYDLKNHLTEEQVADFAASFQKTAVDILLEKLEMALDEHPEVKSVVFAGGVSANEILRKRASETILSGSGLEFSSTSYAGQPAEPSLRDEPVGDVRNIRVENSNRNTTPKEQSSDASSPKCFFPAPSLSGDNGAMVAAAAYFEISSGVEPTDPYSLNIYPRISVES